jgi:hypothetical protein
MATQFFGSEEVKGALRGATLVLVGRSTMHGGSCAMGAACQHGGHDKRHMCHGAPCALPCTRTSTSNALSAHLPQNP